jgi:diaminopimelate decarboxylase
VISSQLRDIGSPGAYRATPHRIFRRDTAVERLEAVAALRDSLNRPGLTFVAGYSFKTNPRAEMLAAARHQGYHAEVISPDELRWAGESGFSRERTIYNGPYPLRDLGGGAPIDIVFADSVEAFERNARRRIARLQGVRMRPSMIPSRFGVPLEDDAALAVVAGSLEPPAPLAVSFHARRGDFRGASWRDVADDVIQRAVRVQARSGRSIAAFDVGGGWTPAEFDADFVADMTWLLDRVVPAFPRCTHVMFEPGQAVCTPAEALITEVLEVRRRHGRREVVVDAGYPDWPQMHEYVHGLYAWRDGDWQRMGAGPDRILGRTCLEYDAIEGLRLPHGLQERERILITDTGSYDHSMSYDFARGAGAQRPPTD